MFDYGVDLDSSMLELRDRLDMIRRALPASAGEPMVMRFDPNAMPIMQVGISGKWSHFSCRWWMDGQITRKLVS